MEARFSDPHYVSQTSSSTNLSNAAGRRALIVGAGPAGLRAAVEMCLLRCDKIVVLEKRNTFNRVNVMRIHTKDMDELVHQLGARDFYRKICVQDRDVVAIRRMQIVFMKMALCLGAEIIPQAELAGIEPDKDTPYWTARTTTSTPHDLKCNTLVLAGGEKSKLSSDFGFSRTSFRAGVATGITCNFVPSHSPAAADAMQGGVVSYLSAPFFNSLKEKGLDLENLASYITEESHYLVMTPKRSTLLNKGIVKEDRADPVELVQRDNVDRDNLLKFAREVATMAGVPPDSEFLQTTSSKGGPPRPDVAIFDFTGKTCATEPSKAITSTFTPPGSNTRHPKTLLVALVGDALVEPFWPMGTGWARAVGSCKALGDCLRELGPDPLKWGERVEAVLKAHAEQYIVLKSESYAPMTNVMGSS
ncbi:uncharacterized protein EV422DRAFT_523465 [Fimicolochytrium jonesii]|uniref:uncharacterized protein n=1 Tax=Fimicolochytrium jonesii TaxID=1396493 RepID=UPI0022FE76A7|nr:uncharacterized protein EV422DRAFT_523465 [Fimicolochytrium jonesii]KAI8823120.1 hypothetical protein EV422DRAFT_523465 [Fimicolochytrium jonesii]